MKTESEYLTPEEDPNATGVMDFRAYRVKWFLRGKDVLDMGCGCGYMASEYSKLAKSVLGIDISESAIRYAKEHYPDIPVKLMDMRTMEFKGQFDAVVATEVIEHVSEEDGAKAVERAAEALRPCGLFMGCVPTKDDTKTYIYHKSFYTKEKLEGLLKKHFDRVVIEEIGGANLPSSWLFKAWKWAKALDSPRVSVVMSAHNTERYVGDAIASVVGQTFKDFELIICDDGSTDGSMRAIEEYAKTDSRITVIRNERNMGITKTLNRMLKAAKGEYVCQLDSDDIMLPDRLETAVKFMDEHGDIGGTYSDYIWIGESGEMLREMECPEFDLNLLFMSEYINQATTMYRRCCVEWVGLYDEELDYSQDSLVKFEVGYLFGLGKIPSKLVKYRLRRDSITQSKNDRQKGFQAIAKRKFSEHYPEFRRPKVTVGVPVYNPEPEMLRKCLQSIKDQTYKNYEVVVVDDGSTNVNEVPNIVSEFGFKYFRQDNKGIGGARNAVIDHMSEDSDYLCYLSHDDKFSPEYLMTMVVNAKEKSGIVMFTDYYIIDKDDNITNEFAAPQFPYQEDMRVAALSQAERNTMFVNLSTTFIPADLIRKERFLDELRFGEDLEWVLRLMLVRKVRFGHIQAPLVSYRLHLGSTTTKRFSDITENNGRILRMIGGMSGW